MRRRSKELVPFLLTDRTPIYRVGSVSVPTRLMCGVQQGSIIGPSQFTAYTEDIKDTISMSHHLYADDTQMLAIKATNQSLGACCRELETCISSVQRWCAVRRLQLNPNKTEFICFGSAVQLESASTSMVSTSSLSTVYVTLAYTWTADSTCVSTSTRSSRPAVFIYDDCVICTIRLIVMFAHSLCQRSYFPESTIAMLCSPV